MIKDSVSKFEKLLDRKALQFCFFVLKNGDMIRVSLGGKRLVCWLHRKTDKVRKKIPANIAIETLDAMFSKELVVSCFYLTKAKPTIPIPADPQKCAEAIGSIWEMKQLLRTMNMRSAKAHKAVDHHSKDEEFTFPSSEVKKEPALPIDELDPAIRELFVQRKQAEGVSEEDDSKEEKPIREQTADEILSEL